MPACQILILLSEIEFETGRAFIFCVWTFLPIPSNTFKIIACGFFVFTMIVPLPLVGLGKISTSIVPFASGGQSSHAPVLGIL